jgi:signal transduction histidine kinase
MTDLESCELFRGLAGEEFQSLRHIAQERAFAAGARIFSEGDSGDGVYVIRDGLVEIAHIVGEHARRVFSQFGPGDIFGEMAVIEDMPRSATAIAAKETKVYFIPRSEMITLLRRSPALSFKLLQEVSRRLRDFNQLHLREIVHAERLAVIGNFARSIVHDLKTPLTVISLAAEIMSAPNVAHKQRREFHARVKHQIVRINEMVGDIIDFTQSLRPETAMPSISYRTFIQSLVGELRAETEFKATSVRLENEPPDVKLQLDPRRLRRVIFNLAGNAADMMPSGGAITLRFQNDGNEITTEIQDDGPGIAPEIADKLFQPFATHGKSFGTGLGLSICKKIIEDHAGRISARNAPERGAIFSFTLPLPK